MVSQSSEQVQIRKFEVGQEVWQVFTTTEEGAFILFFHLLA